jgi:hypothetical protein
MIRKEICSKCGFEISSQNIKKHAEICDGRGPRKKRPKNRSLWCKGKKYEDIFGEKRSLEIKESISRGLSGKSHGIGHTKEIEDARKKKISISMRGNGNGATTFRRQKIKYKEIIFKSKWEINTAKFFDLNGINWKYEDKVYNLSETTSYRPDFSIYENKIFIKHIEIKGYWRKDNKEKFELFLRMYPNIKIEIWDKKVLLNKNIPTM